jgi:hypothetical protein
VFNGDYRGIRRCLVTLQVHHQVKVIMVGRKYVAPNYGAGGGGGASAVGGNGTTTVGGNGGAGTASSITGSSVTRAGGGGGGTYNGRHSWCWRNWRWR